MIKDKTKQRSSIQKHHLSYVPEIIVKLYKKEHYALTYIERFNPISKGFIRCLKNYIQRKKQAAIKL